MPEKLTERLNLSLTQYQFDVLKFIAGASGLSKGEIIRRLIDKHEEELMTAARALDASALGQTWKENGYE